MKLFGEVFLRVIDVNIGAESLNWNRSYCFESSSMIVRI